MKVSCPSCSAKYSIADEKVRNRLAKIRCRKCETTIVIDGKTDPPTIQTADTTVGRSDEYTVDISDNDQRQMTVAQLVAAYNEGTITGDTYVWKDGMADWEPLANVTELNDALHRAAAEAAASLAPATSIPPSASYSAPAATAVPQVVAARDPFSAGAAFGSAAGARAATRAGGGDLFGAIDRAGSEGDLATSAADINPTVPTTGARNESSVLFSLSALTGGEKAKPSQSRDSADDSGLIDLAALASRSDTRPPSIIASPIGVSPLGAPLVGGSTSSVGADGVPLPQPAARSNGAMWIGLGIAVAGLAIGGVFLLKEPPPPPPTTIAIPTALPTPAEVPTAGDKTETPEAEDKAAKAGEGATDGKPDDKPSTKPGRRYTPKPSPKPSDTKPDDKKTDEKKPDDKKPEVGKDDKPKKKTCNCKPGDLMCAMKCSAK